jgi:uncharacterized protein (UPF0218 family)
MRGELKAPLGELLCGTPQETAQQLKKTWRKPPLFAIVGDFVAANLLNAGFEPDLIVIDGKTLRVEVEPVKHGMTEVSVPNVPATVDARAWAVLREAVTLKRRVAVVVQGEEDLLVLPLLAEMPLGSVIAYGQPHEGLVVVTVTGEKRDWARNFLTRMEMK